MAFAQREYGQGYRLPRRQVGGQHVAAQDRMNYGRGFNARTAGRFGGRPRGQFRRAEEEDRKRRALQRNRPRGVGGGYGGLSHEMARRANVNVQSRGAQQAAARRYRGVQRPQTAPGPGGMVGGQFGLPPQVQGGPVGPVPYMPQRPPVAGQYGGYQAPNMNQMNAMTRYQTSPRNYVRQPWGGTQAVRRWY